jgi:hypothetical protein
MTDQARQVASHTNRIRKALRDLPKDTSVLMVYPNSNAGALALDRTREDLQEIVGSAVAIAEHLGIEL